MGGDRRGVVFVDTSLLADAAGEAYGARCVCSVQRVYHRNRD